MKKEKSCGVICFKKENNALEVLIIKHRFGGHFSFPKGHVEAGETEEQTALRELYEETGAQVTLIQGFREATIYSPAKNVKKEVVFFAGYLLNSQFVCQPSEVIQIKLVHTSEAFHTLTYETDRKILQLAMDFINSDKAE